MVENIHIKFSKMRSNILLTASVIIFFVASCTKYNDLPQVDFAVDEIELEVGFGDPALTKSSINAAVDAVYDWNLYVYLDGTLYLKHYSEDGSRIRLATGNRYNFYVLANTGRMDAPVKETDIAGLEYRADNVSVFNEKGFPMCCSESAYVKEGDSRLDFRLKKLVARYDLSIDDRLLDKTSFTLMSVSVCQSALNVFPFALRSVATLTGDCDYSSQEDVSILSGGGTVSFYMLENCQGNLLPYNMDEWKKVPENISSKKALCTYISVKGKWAKLGADADIEYRMYLGKDNHSDFDIERNKTYEVTLCLTDEGSQRSSWRVALTNERDLTELRFARSVVNAYYKGDRKVRIISKPEGIGFNLSWNQQKVDYMFAKLSQIDNYLYIDTRGTPFNDTLIVGLYSENGVLKDEMTINVISGAFYVIFKDEGCVLGPGQDFCPEIIFYPSLTHAYLYSTLTSDNEDVAVGSLKRDENQLVTLKAVSPGFAEICVTNYSHPEYYGVYVTPYITSFDGIPAPGKTIDMKVGERRVFHLQSLPTNEQPAPMSVSVASGSSVSITDNSPIVNEHFEVNDIDYGTIFNGVDFELTAVSPGISTVRCKVEYPSLQTSFKVNVSAD